MRVKMLSTLAGPDVPPAQPGTIVDLDKKMAEELVDAGFAERVEDPKPAKSRRERATAEPEGETAALDDAFDTKAEE